MTAVAAPVPLWVRVRMAHAAVQFTFQAAGIPALHVKGPALSPQVAWPGRESTDTDVLIPKSRAAECLNVLANHGWALETRFENSSAFEHSANLHHEIWGYLDLHRIMPGFGIDPDEAFEILWRDHEMTEIAGVPCAVPTLPGQILVVLLHAGRSRLVGRAARDVEYAWSTADTATKENVRRLALELDAELGFDAAFGRLDAHRDDPAYQLWLGLSTGRATRAEEWAARIRAAPTWPQRARLTLRATLVNVDHLAAVRGRRPSRLDVVVEFFARPVRGLREEWTARVSRRRGRRP